MTNPCKPEHLGQSDYDRLRWAKTPVGFFSGFDFASAEQSGLFCRLRRTPRPRVKQMHTPQA